MKKFRHLILPIGLFVMALAALLALTPQKAQARICVNVSPSASFDKESNVSTPTLNVGCGALIFRNINDYNDGQSLDGAFITERFSATLPSRIRRRSVVRQLFEKPDKPEILPRNKFVYAMRFPTRQTLFARKIPFPSWQMQPGF